MSETNRQRLQRAHRCKHARAACVPLADLSSRFSLVPPKEPRSPRWHVPSDPSSVSPQKPGRAEASHASALRAVTLPVVTPRLAAPPSPPPPRLATAPPTMISSAKLVFNMPGRGLWVPVAVRSTAGSAPGARWAGLGLPLPFGAEAPLPLPPAAATGAGHGWMVFGPRGPVSRLGPPLPFGAETPLPLPLPALWVRVEGERSEARTWLGSPALRKNQPTTVTESLAQLKVRGDIHVSKRFVRVRCVTTCNVERISTGEPDGSMVNLRLLRVRSRCDVPSEPTSISGTRALHGQPR